MPILIRDYRLSEDLRKVLKQPFGPLLPNTKVNHNEIHKRLNKDKMIITVGDATTEILIKMGIIPSVQIVDGKEMRYARPLPESQFKTKIEVQNPAGFISKDSIEAIITSIKAKKPVRIIVEGEEDLLTLPCIIFFPIGSVVLYGQPKKGMVIVKVDGKSKRNAITLMKKMLSSS